LAGGDRCRSAAVPALLAVALVSAPGPAVPRAAAAAVDELSFEEISGLSLEDLLRINVTSVAGIEKDLFQTPTAITVLTSDDIRRSGARTIAEALRLVPGMFVGRSGSHSWRIGARGFSGQLAPRNLVLIDGRVVYDPLFGGVFWEVQDVLLGDIDRIEVIRGPGATLWGANAVNGVINVITRDAADTQGWKAVAGAGTHERAFGSVRYGGTADDSTAFRVYAKYVDVGTFEDGLDQAADDWSIARGGFRLDHWIDPQTRLTVNGEGYASLDMGELTIRTPQEDEQEGGGAPSDQSLGGGFFITRLEHMTPGRSGWTLQQYYDRTNHEQSILSVRRDTFAVEFRQFFEWGRSNEFAWGVGNRFTHDDSEQIGIYRADPPSRTLNAASAFAQNTFVLAPDRWFLMIGSKLEHETYTGLQLEPGVRLWFTPDHRNTFWSAVSRPVRTPSRLENESTVGFSTPAGFAPLLLPGRDLKAEQLLAYEIGWRTRPKATLTFDTALFYNDYSRLIGFDPAVAAGIAAPWKNLGEGRSYGVEFSGEWRASDQWRLAATYSLARSDIDGPIFDMYTGESPQQQASIRSYLDLRKDVELNSILYYVDPIRGPDVPRYYRLDTGVSWRASPRLRVSVWGQNLLDPSYPEASLAREFPRGFYAEVALEY
jgi:iron complex outermembrane receptor protein